MNAAGYEANLMAAEILQNVLTNKFIPVLREGDWNNSSPIFLRGRVGIDMTKDKQYDAKLTELLRELYKVDQKPDIGERPHF